MGTATTQTWPGRQEADALCSDSLRSSVPDLGKGAGRNVLRRVLKGDGIRLPARMPVTIWVAPRGERVADGAGMAHAERVGR